MCAMWRVADPYDRWGRPFPEGKTSLLPSARGHWRQAHDPGRTGKQLMPSGRLFSQGEVTCAAFAPGKMHSARIAAHAFGESVASAKGKNTMGDWLVA